MNTKVKKVLSKTANVLAIIIGILVLIIAISSLSSSISGNGYASLFGYTTYAVKSDSMQGENSDSFNKHDLIVVKLLNDVQRTELQEGQVITFYTMILGNREINTHRIVNVYNNGALGVTYQTRGDKYQEGLDPTINSEDIIGVYSSKIAAVGGFILFTQSADGFLIMIVIPSLLVVLYCAYLLFKNFRTFSKEKREIDLENMKKELLKEIQQKENKID